MQNQRILPNSRPNRTAVVLPYLILATIIAVIFAASAAQATPTLEISPTTIEAGDIILITYDGFAPGGYEGTINIDGEPVETIDILPGGHLSFFWITPSDLTPGGHDFDICAACDQGDLEERTNTVRVTVETGNLEDDEFNLQVWAIEITQGVRGDIPTRTPPDDDLFFPSEDVVHVANRRTVVRVYPWVEGGPDFDYVNYVRANLWVTVDGSAYGPLVPENPYGIRVRADATMNDLRSDLGRTWNFVLPPEATRLPIDRESDDFTLYVDINPEVPGQVDECTSCFDDNYADFYNNQFRHVGQNNSFAFKFRPYLMECEVEQDDGSTNLVQRPTLTQLAASLRSFYDVLPIADGSRGVRLMPWRNVDWDGHQDDWDEGQDEWLIANFLPGGELHAGPSNDFYAFMYWGGGPNCSGHAFLGTPFLRTSACPGPPYVAAHEVNHAIGAAHAGNGHGEDGGGGYDTSYPGWHGQVETNTWGMDVFNLRLYPPTTTMTGDNSRHCFMSYGGTEWVSRYSWELTADNLGSPAIDPTKGLLPNILIRQDKADDLDYVAFRGIRENNGNLEIAPFFASYLPEQAPGDGYYTLEFYDANNGFLHSHALRDDQMVDVGEHRPLFAESIAVPVGWSTMQLREGNIVTDSWQRSLNRPAVAITAPTQGFQWPNEGTVTLTWVSDDADNDPLWYRIFGLHNADGEIFTLASGLTEQSFDLDLSTLPGGGEWVIVLEVSDGFDRMYSPFVSGFVDPTAPQVVILEPQPDAVHVVGSHIPAVGMAADIQGEILDGNINWYVDNNYLGSGSVIEFGGLTPGSHQLRCVVYNVYQEEGSATVDFTLVDALAVPELIAPDDGAPAVASPVNLDWTASPGAISYRVQVARDANFSDVAAELGNLGESNVEFETDEQDQTYYWRAMAEHGTAPSGWSSSYSFTTADDMTPVEDLPGRPVLDLSVFPNPFNPTTTVAFELPTAGNATVAVYDLAGRRIRSLASGFIPAGRHSVKWDGRDDRGETVGSGVYLVRLESRAGIVSRRALLLK